MYMYIRMYDRISIYIDIMCTSNMSNIFSQRSFFLFLIGIALNTLGTNAQLENIRIFGVLQRLGITYLIVGLLYLCFTPQQSKVAQVWKHQVSLYKSYNIKTREMCDCNYILFIMCTNSIIIMH